MEMKRGGKGQSGQGEWRPRLPSRSASHRRDAMCNTIEGKATVESNQTISGCKSLVYVVRQDILLEGIGGPSVDRLSDKATRAKTTRDTHRLQDLWEMKILCSCNVLEQFLLPLYRCLLLYRYRYKTKCHLPDRSQ